MGDTIFGTHEVYKTADLHHNVGSSSAHHWMQSFCLAVKILDDPRLLYYFSIHR